MTIASLKELDSLIRLCRRRGVDCIEVDGVKIVLGSAPLRNTRAEKESPNQNVFPEPSAEEMLMWSAIGPAEPTPQEDA